MSIATERLSNQRLSHGQLATPAEVVAWLGAVQAQEYALAQWAIALRMQQASAASIEAACDAGAILRTHVLRPTWHFVTPEDIRWLLELTAPRVHSLNATMYRKLELDPPLLQRCGELIAAALAGGKHLTRAEIGTLLSDHGVDTSSGMRLGYITHFAELEGLICSGARSGKQHTYALLSERAPQARQLPRDAALAELTRRFFSSHGPATVKDFARWSGLTLSDGKAGLAMLAGQLEQLKIDGETYWRAAAPAPHATAPASGYLLPIYDEYTNGYKQPSAICDQNMYDQLLSARFFSAAFVYRDEIIGMWRRTFDKGHVVIELEPLRPFTSAEQAAFRAAAQRFAAFLDLPVVLPAAIG